MDNLSIIQLHPSDNVAVCTRLLEPGDVIVINNRSTRVISKLQTGHKLATQFISCGEPVIKYGLCIGTAIIDIEPGMHVHMHNLKSNYIPVYLTDEVK